MRRRTVIVGVAAALAAAGCSRSNGAPSAPADGLAMPEGIGPVVQWSLVGGDLPAPQLALRPPRLSVYRTGEVIADATYRTDLRHSEVMDLLTRLSADLREARPVKRRDDWSTLSSDAATTEVTVHTATATRTGGVPVPDQLRDEKRYPAALYDARDSLDALHDRIVSTGQPYIADRVRLIAHPGQADASEVLQWPTSIEVPAQRAAGDVLLADCEGQRSRDIVTLLARDLDLNGAWRTYRTTDGLTLCATWRYLLPGE